MPRARQNEMELIDCGVCGSGEVDRRLKATDWLHGSHESFEYVRCRHCGLFYLRERPTEDGISRYYPEHSYYTFQSDGGAPPARPAHDRLAKRLTKQVGEPGRFVDIGCGDGSFLAAMVKNRWEGIGTEVHIPTVERLNSLGYTALAGKLGAVDLPNYHFNLVTMLEVLEHVHKPMETLREARRLLAPGGMLYVTTPNIASAEFRLYGPRWVALEPPLHLQLFSPDSLEFALSEAGFSRIQVTVSETVDGLTRSLWLALQNRRRGDPGHGGKDVPEFVAHSWRRTAHRGLNVLLWPLGQTLGRLQLGPGLEAVAYCD